MTALRKPWLAVWLLVLALAACVALPTPESMSQRLAYADASLTAMVNTVADLREGGLISDANYPPLVQVLESADTAMTAAWVALGAGNLETAQDQLQLVNRLLYAVRERIPEATTHE